MRLEARFFLEILILSILFTSGWASADPSPPGWPGSPERASPAEGATRRADELSSTWQEDCADSLWRAYIDIGRIAPELSGLTFKEIVSTPEGQRRVGLRIKRAGVRIAVNVFRGDGATCWTDAGRCVATEWNTFENIGAEDPYGYIQTGWKPIPGISEPRAYFSLTSGERPGDVAEMVLRLEKGSDACFARMCKRLPNRRC